MKIYSASVNYLDEIQKAEAGDVKAMIRVAFAILHGNKPEKLQPEEEEPYIIERAEQEWISINRDADAEEEDDYGDV